MAMPPGPPQDAEAPQMSPEDAQQVLAKFGITKPEDIAMVSAACEALEPPEEGEGQAPAAPPQKAPGGLMAALGQRFQG